jgi:CRP/FNR family transcriptional regulator, cyclic AMP receptor protein
MSRKPANVQIRTFRPGDVIFREGDAHRDEAFLVHAGRVEVRKKVGDEERLLRIYGKGELLGELGLFTGGSPRSATAVAAEAVTLMVIPATQLDHLVRTNPTLAVAIIHDLSAKLLATNRLLVAEGEGRGADPGSVTS